MNNEFTISLQLFPLQTNPVFDDHANPMVNPGDFSPIGFGGIPRHLNIHIHADKLLQLNPILTPCLAYILTVFTHIYIY